MTTLNEPNQIGKGIRETVVSLKLTAAYNDPAKFSKNVNILASRAGVTPAEAKTFLQQLPSAQVTKKHVAPSESQYVPLSGAMGHYVADVMHLKTYASVNNRKGAIFILINSNTRFAYCRALTVDTLYGTAR
jgi:hypothetical protein